MWKWNLFLLGLLLFLLSTVILVTACEPGGEPIIDNQSNHNVTIYVIRVREDGTLGDSRNYGVVLAKTTKEIGSITFIPKAIFRIEAVTSSGEVIFSKDYNMDDLEKINWKIVIPPY